jgi:hypothetical protein
MFLMATALGKKAPKYGIQRKNCSLKYALNFEQKFW